MDMIKRPRRLRGGEYMRKMVRETRMDKSSLIYPMFVQEGMGKEDEISSMPGQFRYTLDRLPYELERVAKAGVGSVMLFGIPDVKDEIASHGIRAGWDCAESPSGSKRKISGDLLYYRRMSL